MSKRTIPVLLALAVLLAACGPQATPTMNPADVQGTAVAAAWTMVAATQAAIPTATPLPPTAAPSPTTLPTFTAMPLTTSLSTAIPTVTRPAAASTNDCLSPLDFGAAGPTSPVRIENESGGTIFSISLNLYERNAFGECGAMAVTNIPKNQSETVQLPKGKWFAYAWINYANGSASTASGSFELKPASDDLTRLVVRPDVILAKGP